jgi:thioredoxin reductase (NADPH)
LLSSRTREARSKIRPQARSQLPDPGSPLRFGRDDGKHSLADIPTLDVAQFADRTGDRVAMQDFDLVVIGAGVAGLTAAITAGRLGLSVAVVDRLGPGGQIVNAEKIENLPGFPQGIAGYELGPLLQEQAEAAGAAFLLDEIQRIEIDGERRIVHGAEDSLAAPALIVAAGSSLRGLGIPGEDEFRGRGVSHCASCDGPLFAGQEVCVVGGGDSALDEALVLAAHAAKVTLYHRGEHLAGQEVLRARAAAAPNIALVGGTTVETIAGADTVTGVHLRDAAGERRLAPVTGVFVYIGLDPNTAFLQGVLALDNAGHVETDVMMQSSVAGIFAAGDIRRHSVALLAAAAGDGATAAIAAFRYLESRRRGGP